MLVIAPRYYARPPWRGPILGERFTQDNEELIRIAAASDPFSGNADVAAFVPVSKQKNEERYFPADKNGQEQKVVDVGWVQCFDRDSGDGPPISVPVDWCTGKFAGVLVILLYPELGRGGSNFPTVVAQFLKTAVGGSVALGLAVNFDLKKPIRISNLPVPIRDDVVTAIEALLKEAVSELRAGLIEIYA